MESILKPISVKTLKDNVFKLLDNDWMLITAGNKESFNTMTASWGTFGILWNKPIAIGFIRPHRFTFEFVNKAEYFTLTFFTEQHRETLNYIGSHTGRTSDKIKDTGLHILTTEHGSIYYSEARLVMECKKLYVDDLKEENFVINSLVKDIYPSKDFHRFFIGEIVNCLCTDSLISEKVIKLDREINDL
jgi:flavin reductase (DIM6/NTAB) family NADH-FMN oxidoreductase RutF